MVLKSARKQFRSDLRRLPLTLGKLCGAILAVIGFPWAIDVATTRTGPEWGQLAPGLALGSAGIFLFVLCSRLAARRLDPAAEPALTGVEKKRISMLSWLILCSLIALLALISVVIGR